MRSRMSNQYSSCLLVYVKTRSYFRELVITRAAGQCVKSGCADLRMLQGVKCGYMLQILNVDVWVKSGCADVTL